MKSLFQKLALSFMLCAFASSVGGAEISAKQLAARMHETMLGSAKIRVRLETTARGAQTPVLQLMIKERRAGRTTDVAYEVLWPPARKGETIVLHQKGLSAPSGSAFIPPNTVQQLRASDMDERMFGSDLAYQDAIEDFFAWPVHSFLGSESIGGVGCVILESKPGGSGTIYGKVRSWIDPHRLVPMRIEKFSRTGHLMRIIETTRVVSDQGHPVPGSLTVSSRSGTVTKLSGSRIDRDVHFSRSDFSQTR